MTNAYFEVVSDIDCNALIIPSLSGEYFLANFKTETGTKFITSSLQAVAVGGHMLMVVILEQ